MSVLRNILFAFISIIVLTTFNTNLINAKENSFERATWKQLKKEKFEINNITKQDVENANKVADTLGDKQFKEDKNGYATMNIKSIKDKYGDGVANVFKLGLTNINSDIAKDSTKFAPDHKSFIKGDNYNKYIKESKDKFTEEKCTKKGAGKAVVGGAVDGAVAAGAGYYATCWW